MALLSPGVEVIERDASLSPSLTGSTFGVYCGNFSTGPCDSQIILANKQDLIKVYGKPTDDNYNDWFQCWNFLSYSNGLYVTRLVDRNGQTNKSDTGNTLSADVEVDDTIISLSTTTGIFENCYIAIGNESTVYQVETISGTDIGVSPAVTHSGSIGDKIYLCTPSYNAAVEVEKVSGTTPASIKPFLKTIANYAEYEIMQDSIALSNSSNIKLRFTAKYPGKYGNYYKIAVAKTEDFVSGVTEAFPGINLNAQLQYYPSANEVAILVYDDIQNIVVETFMVSLSTTAKDSNNKSAYIEDVINRQSSYIYVNNNVGITDMPASKLGVNAIQLTGGTDGKPGKDEYIIALNDLYGDKDYIDIDLVIGNQIAPIETATFAKTRADCLAIIGASYSDVVGLKAELAISNLLNYRASGDLNIDNKYSTFIANYAYQYDQFNDYTLVA